MILFVFCMITVVVLLIACMSYNRLQHSSVTWMHHQPHSISMVSIRNPFELKLQNSTSASLQGIKLLLSSKVKYMIQEFWGVHVKDLFKTLENNYLALRKDMLHGNLLSGSYQFSSGMTHEFVCKNECRNFTPSIKLDAITFGTGPRTSYPFVLFMVQEDVSECIDDTVVCGLISVIHIKDEILMLETHMINQYLKLSNNCLCEIKNLYVSSVSGCDDDNDDSTVEKLCIVCQMDIVSVVIQPCLHMCICQQCFQKLDKCPLCRSLIHAYFTVVPNE